MKEKLGSSVTTTRPPPFIVRLRSASITEKVRKAKQGYNLLHARDLNPLLLGQRDRPNILFTNIYFNEVLPKNIYDNFKTLKVSAKNLGFKYVWHRKDRFLVKWRDGEKSHFFKSIAELHKLAAAYNTTAAKNISSELNKTARLAQGAEGPRARSVNELRAAFLNACSLKKPIEKIWQYLNDNLGYDIFGVAENA